jgi:CheY-like chemotaxis protein
MQYHNILLIDDDNDDADFFIEAINSLHPNLSCKAETNPVKALEFLNSTEILPDLIFLDYNMPILNGSEFLQKMRESSSLKEIQVIIYSTYSETAAEHLSIITGSERFMTKPDSFTELVAVLRKILIERQ